MTAATTLLARIDGVRDLGGQRWIARCPSHDDRRASLAIRETGDGTLLVRCFAGCAVGDIMGAVGLAMRDLFPAARHHLRAPERRPYDPTQVLVAIAHEAMVVALSAEHIITAGAVADDVRDRLGVACGRIQRALDAVGELPEPDELRRLRRGEYTPAVAS